MTSLHRSIFSATLASFFVLPLSAEDWFRWRGPDGTGISQESLATEGWPDDELEVVWRAELGTGFSSVVVKDGRLFASGNQNDVDTLFCLDAKSGKEIWKHFEPAEVWPYLYEGGPNATVTLDDDYGYFLGRHGLTIGFEAATGKVLWKVDLHNDLKMKKPSWGFTSAPLVDGARLVLNAGTRGLALDKSNGEVLWETGKEDAGYATPELFEVDNKKAYITFTSNAIAAVDAESGNLWWETPWETQFKVNAAQPIVSQGQMFISSAYGFGSALFAIDATSAKKIWRNQAMENHFNSCILIDGHLYGISGTDASKSDLRCVDWKTGEVKWTHEGTGLGSVIAAKKHLIVLTDKGELLFADASPEKFNPSYRAQILGGKCWTPPVLSNGLIYARNAKGDLVCVKAP